MNDRVMRLVRAVEVRAVAALQDEIERLRETLKRQSAAHHKEVQEQTAAERERCVRIIEAYQVPVGNSAAGEMAADWTLSALREIRNSIRGLGESDAALRERLGKETT